MTICIQTHAHPRAGDERIISLENGNEPEWAVAHGTVFFFPDGTIVLYALGRQFRFQESDVKEPSQGAPENAVGFVEYEEGDRSFRIWWDETKVG